MDLKVKENEKKEEAALFQKKT